MGHEFRGIVKSNESNVQIRAIFFDERFGTTTSALAQVHARSHNESLRQTVRRNAKVLVVASKCPS